MNGKEVIFCGFLSSFAFMSGMHLVNEGLTWNFIGERIFTGGLSFVIVYGSYLIYQKLIHKIPILREVKN